MNTAPRTTTEMGMSGAVKPRCIVVTRRTPIEMLLERHGTLGQARFYQRSRGQSIEDAERIHECVQDALRAVEGAIPADQRRARVDRDLLASFVFGPDDLIVVVGQDGLVPNAAKYLKGQPVIGVNPDPKSYDGVLCRHRPEGFAAALAWANRELETGFKVQARVMAEAKREDGQRLLALNEVFIGHRTHQSARYRISAETTEERQSSSGIIVSTGTGATGWGRSIAQQRGLEKDLPRAEEASLAWFVREPFPSVATGTKFNHGRVKEGSELRVVSEMGEGGVIFADGIEVDWVEFTAGQVVTVGVAAERLRLVVPG